MRLFIIPLIFIFIHFGLAQKNHYPEALAPEMMKQFPNVRDFTLSSDGNEAYFTAQSPLSELSVIATIHKKDSQWSFPEIVTFSGIYNDLEPFLSPDGLRLYFVSNRPVKDDDNKSTDYDIWYVQRLAKGSRWSQPLNPGAPLNSRHNEFYPSVALNGNLYFTCDAPTSLGKDDIFISRWTDDHYSLPRTLSDSINTDGYEFNAYIAPDESFLIFSGYNREDGLGSGDLYISYQKDGVWSKAQNLGENINSDKMDYCPFVHTKSAMLYFTSKRSSLTAPSTRFSNMDDFLSKINIYQNGLSRIYKAAFDSFIK